MARIIVCAGNKGGAGKSLVSHAIAHGLALHGVSVFHISTDIGRQILSADTRRYATLDGRQPKQLGQLVDKLATMEQAVAIIDGGGNRPEVDRVLSSVADLTILPFMQSQTDLRVVRADLDRLPEAVGMPNRWPPQKWARDAADRELKAELGPYISRLMSRLPEINALSTLLRDEGPSPKISNDCRTLALRALDRMGLSLHSLEAPKN
jgi:hypothetical protein